MSSKVAIDDTMWEFVHASIGLVGDEVKLFQVYYEAWVALGLLLCSFPTGCLGLV